MSGRPFSDEDLQDAERFKFALLARYNETGGQWDETADEILQQADLPALVRVLVKTADSIMLGYARTIGGADGDEADVRARIGPHLRAMQAELAADPGQITRPGADGS